jgi:hypothetical protein
MIQAIDLGRLRNSENVQFFGDTLKIVSRNNPTTLLVQAKYDFLNGIQTELEALFKKSTENPITAEIEALDVRRDRAVSGIFGLATAYSFHFDAVLSAPANVILDYAKIYTTNIAKDNYNSETATITNIVNDFETKPALTAAVTALGLTAWKNELKAANTAFATKYLDRTQDLATASPDNLKSKRLQAYDAYYDLRNNIDAHATIAPSALYTKTINEINILISQYNSLLAGRVAAPTPPVG